MSAYSLVNPLGDGNYLFLGFLMFLFILIVFIVIKEELEIQLIVFNIFLVCSLIFWTSVDYDEAKRGTPTENSLLKTSNDVVLCKETLDNYFVLAPIKESEINHIDNIKSYMLKKHHVLLASSVKNEYWLIRKNVASKYGKEEAVRLLKDAVLEVKNEENSRKGWE